jgi:hypothetical protein
LDVLTVGALAFDSTCLSAAWRSGKQKVTKAVHFQHQHQPAHSSGPSQDRRSSPRNPLPSRLLGAGQRAGPLRYKGESNASALLCPQGLFYQKFQLANIPSCVSALSSAFFFFFFLSFFFFFLLPIFFFFFSLPGSAPMTDRARLQSVACVHAPERTSKVPRV